jgi:hypothetical protein
MRNIEELARVVLDTWKEKYCSSGGVLLDNGLHIFVRKDILVIWRLNGNH